MTSAEGRVPAIDPQRQILSNARILWPIVEALNGSEEATIRNTPDFEILVKGVGTTINAEVVWDDDGDWIIFMQTRNTISAKKAVDLLLQMTMNMINKYHHNNVFIEDDAKKRDVKGPGHFYQPTQ